MCFVAVHTIGIELEKLAAMDLVVQMSLILCALIYFSIGRHSSKLWSSNWVNDWISVKWRSSLKSCITLDACISFSSWDQHQLSALPSSSPVHFHSGKSHSCVHAFTWVDMTYDISSTSKNIIRNYIKRTELTNWEIP